MAQSANQRATGQSISLLGKVPIEIMPGLSSHHVGFGCVAFHGRISNGTPRSSVIYYSTSQEAVLD